MEIIEEMTDAEGTHVVGVEEVDEPGHGESREEKRDRRLRERALSLPDTLQGSSRSSEGRQNRRSRRDQMDVEVFHAVDKDDRDKLKNLLDAGANVNKVYTDYSKISTKSLLHICCEKGRLECARIVVEHGAFLNIRDKWGQTPLMYCMITQYHEIAEMLCMERSDLVNDRDHYGKSALHCAAESGSLQSIGVLLKYGANVCCHNCFGVTPVMSAVSQGKDCPDPGGVVKMMIDAGYNLEKKDFRSLRTALQMAVLAPNIPAVEVLLAAGANTDTIDGGSRTPLGNAIFRFVKKSTDDGSCYVEQDGMVIIVLLTQFGSNLNMPLEKSNPLAGCALLNAAELTQYFLDNGSNPAVQCLPVKTHVVEDTGATPLLLATKANNFSVVKAFLRWNCNLEIKCPINLFDQELSLTALDLALLLGHMDIARLLIVAGASLQSLRCLGQFTHGEIPFALRDNPAFYDWLQDLASTPQSLYDICISCIRSRLSLGVTNKAQRLPVPPQIKESIILSDKLAWAEMMALA